MKSSAQATLCPSSVWDSYGITVAGSPLRYPTQGSTASLLDYPYDLSIDANGSLYVLDAGNYRVQKFPVSAVNGTTVAGGNGIGSGLNMLNSSKFI